MTSELAARGGVLGWSRFKLSFPNATQAQVEEFFDFGTVDSRTVVKLRPPKLKMRKGVIPGLTHKDYTRACAVQRLMGRFGNVQVK
jgi:hypothetical protein